MNALPFFGTISPVNILNVVLFHINNYLHHIKLNLNFSYVFPAPLRPKRPKHSFFLTPNPK